MMELMADIIKEALGLVVELRVLSACFLSLLLPILFELINISDKRAVCIPTLVLRVLQPHLLLELLFQIVFVEASICTLKVKLSVVTVYRPILVVGSAPVVVSSTPTTTISWSRKDPQQPLNPRGLQYLLQCVTQRDSSESPPIKLEPPPP